MGSLVATAWALALRQEAGKTSGRVALLHRATADPTAAQRWEHVQRQAAHYQIADVVYLPPQTLPHTDEAAPRGPVLESPSTSLWMATPGLLLQGMSQALDLGAPTLVWPVRCGEDLEAASRATQQAILVEQLAQLETSARDAARSTPETPATTTPNIAVPLLELTDRQVVELGANLGVPWELAWSCQQRAMQPCGVCVNCRRRAAAFAAAQLPDPQRQLAKSDA